MSKEQRLKDSLIQCGIIQKCDRVTIARVDYGYNSVVVNGKVIGKCSYNGTDYFFEGNNDKHRSKNSKTSYKGQKTFKGKAINGTKNKGSTNNGRSNERLGLTIGDIKWK